MFEPNMFEPRQVNWPILFYNEGVNEWPVSDGKRLPSLMDICIFRKGANDAAAFKKNIMSHRKSLVIYVTFKNGLISNEYFT